MIGGPNGGVISSREEHTTDYTDQTEPWQENCPCLALPRVMAFFVAQDATYPA
jgi:hypothetical protein